MTKPQLLVVDDDPDLCELIEDVLSENYMVHICNDAGDLDSVYSKANPTIALLDINLPNGNGLHLCRSMCQSEGQSPIVLLISGDSSMELKLDAYINGGSDFLAKPFKIRELQAKVDKLHELHETQKQLFQSKKFATKAATIDASQYAELLRFYNAMYTADSCEVIRDKLFELMQSFCLEVSIQFRMETTQSYDHAHKVCSPIELQIYELLSTGERIIAFSNQLMVNGTHASMIIKNMPIEDETNNDRLRDILDTMIDGLDAKLLNLQRLNLLRQTSRELAQSNARLTKATKDHQAHTNNAMNHAISEIHSNVDALELNEGLEKFFAELAKNIILSTEESFAQILSETEIIDCLNISLAASLHRSK